MQTSKQAVHQPSQSRDSQDANKQAIHLPSQSRNSQEASKQFTSPVKVSTYRILPVPQVVNVSDAGGVVATLTAPTMDDDRVQLVEGAFLRATMLGVFGHVNLHRKRKSVGDLKLRGDYGNTRPNGKREVTTGRRGTKKKKPKH